MTPEETQYQQLQEEKRSTLTDLAAAIKVDDENAIDQYRDQLQLHEVAAKRQRDSVKAIIRKANPGSDGNDTIISLLRFVGDTLPKWPRGLIIAIIFLAAWGSIAPALNALASCTMVDFHKRLSRRPITSSLRKRRHSGIRFPDPGHCTGNGACSASKPRAGLTQY